MTELIFEDKDLDMLRAAMACAADKDVRYYLNGVRFGGGFIDATNGHRCARFSKDTQGLEVIVPKFKIPKSVKKVAVSIEGSQATVSLHKKNGPPEVRVLNNIEGRFPDLAGVLPTGEPCPTTDLCFNPNYLQGLSPKSFPILRLESYGPTRAFRVYVAGLPNLIVAVMPVVMGREGA